MQQHGTSSLQYSLRHLAKGVMLYGTTDVAVMGIRFALLALYTRALAPRDFGTLAIVQTSIVLAGAVISQGLPFALMIRYKQVNHTQAHILKDSAFWALLIICIGISTLMLSGSLLINHDTMIKNLMPWLMVWVSSGVMAPIAADSLRIEEKIVRYGIARIGRAGVVAFIVVKASIQGTLDLQTVIRAEAIGASSEFLLSMILDGYLPGRFSLDGWRDLWRTGLPLCIVSLGFLFIDFSDRYLIQSFMGAEATGYYATAARIAICASFLAEAFNAMWTPYYYRIEGSGNMSTKQFHTIYGKLIMLFAVVISFLMLCLPLIVDLKIFDRPFIPPAYRQISHIIPVL
ncbi:MAG: oligosaccharide flippase family protein, partial [Chitinivibrionales bacterium]|nr:oligosaccharide flippase family protein [Chitinivibrionales bacterium]